MLSMVARTSFMSCRLAPSIANPIGTPCPSVSTLRLTPCLPRSVGLRPVFFPPERCLRHRAIPTQPGPVNAVPVVKLRHPRLPELEKDAGCDPFLKAIMGGGLGTEVGQLQGVPLTASTQDVEDGVGALPVRDPR